MRSRWINRKLEKGTNQSYSKLRRGSFSVVCVDLVRKHAVDDAFSLPSPDYNSKMTCWNGRWLLQASRQPVFVTKSKEISS